MVFVIPHVSEQVTKGPKNRAGGLKDRTANPGEWPNCDSHHITSGFMRFALDNRFFAGLALLHFWATEGNDDFAF